MRLLKGSRCSWLPVAANGLRKTCFGFCLMGADVLHPLSHRTDVVIGFSVVIKCISFERMAFIPFTALVFIKIILLHIVFNIIITQVLIVFF
jgi:hypothetical protein